MLLARLYIHVQLISLDGKYTAHIARHIQYNPTEETISRGCSGVIA